MEGQLGWQILDEGWRKGPWTAEEDKLLIEYVRTHGEGRWNSVARFAGLKRNGKSCRLRWVNYLRPDLKRGRITPNEEKIIVELHARWGNRWSTIARSLPGRTDNEIKNYWRTHFKKKGKGSLEQSEKAKHRLFRRQQFQHQQKQLQQHQKYQEGQDDIKKVMSLLDMYPNSCEETCLLSSMFNGSHIPGPAVPAEDMWDGLWNLDNVSASLDAMYASNKASMQTSIVTPFC